MTEHLDRGKWMSFAEIEQASKEAVDAEREAWIIKMLEVRDAFVRHQSVDDDEAYHIIYSLADPSFTSYNPWEEWEAIRQGSKECIKK